MTPLDDQLPNDGLARLGDWPDRVVDHRDRTPADGAVALFGDGPHGDLHGAQALAGVAREKDHADAVVARGRQIDAFFRGHARKKAVGHLNQDPGAVAGLRIRPGGAAVIEPLQDRQRLINERVRRRAVKVDNRPEATGVVFEARVVEASHAATVPNFRAK